VSNSSSRMSGTGLVICAEMLRSGPQSGYELITKYDLLSATVYPMLQRLQNDGLIERTDKPYTKRGPEANHFSLTIPGLEAARWNLEPLQIENLGATVARNILIIEATRSDQG
jgi:DNA-binding PadR family transcriptional regulator